MADVKWIKITTDIFDDEKILLIESLPDSYAIITVWFKLLCLAGKQNNSGVFMMGKIAYTDKMLATIFRMKETTVTMALNTFEQFGMIEIIDGVITIPNWGKHQNLDQLENKKEYMRNYMKGYREKQKALTTGKPLCKTNSKSNVSQADKELERDLEEEKEGDKKEKNKKEKPKNKSSNKSPKNKRGEYNNVLLTEEEEEKLIDEYGIDLTIKAITFLDEYIEETGYKRNSHFLCIKRWVIDAVKEKHLKNGGSESSFDEDEFLNAALKRGFSDLTAPKENPELQARVEALKKQIAES